MAQKPGWTTTAGGCWWHDRQRLTDIEKDDQPGTTAGASGGTFKAALNYAFAPGHASFLSYSTGYTPGGVNTTPQVLDGLPIGPYLNYAAETVRSLEWGIKGRLPEQRLAWTLSIYHMQLRTTSAMCR